MVYRRVREDDVEARGRAERVPLVGRGRVVVTEVPFALAFTSGMVATVNPCGFAMLPAYLALFVSADDGAVPAAQQCRRALGVVAAVSLGFAVVFGVLGMLFQIGVRVFVDAVPYAALAVGAGLVAAGVAMWFGWRPRVAAVAVGAGPRDRRASSMVGFGMSYGVASLSCTLPVFLSVVVGTASRSSVLAGVAALGAFVAGMSAVLVLATLSVAAAQQSIMVVLRRVSRHVHRVSAALLVVTGSYISYYWSWALLTDGKSGGGRGPITLVERRSAALAELLLANWRLVAVLGLAATAAALAASRRQRPDRHQVDSGAAAATAAERCCSPNRVEAHVLVVQEVDQ